MGKYFDTKVIVSGMAAAVGVVVVAMIANAVLPASVPGSSIAKDVLNKAAS